MAEGTNHGERVSDHQIDKSSAGTGGKYQIISSQVWRSTDRFSNYQLQQKVDQLNRDMSGKDL